MSELLICLFSEKTNIGLRLMLYAKRSVVSTGSLWNTLWEWSSL